MKLHKHILIGAACLLLFVPVAHAQLLLATQSPAVSPLTLIITWKTDSFVPNWYQGRTLPVANSLITAAVTALRNGSAVSLANKTIAWRVNGTPVASGVGKTSFTFTVGEFPPDLYKIDVEALEEGKTLGQNNIEIPVTTPRVVISVPYPKQIVPQENGIFEAIPFFFTAAVESLTFRWFIDNVEVPGSAQLDSFISVSFPGVGSNISVMATAANPQRVYEKTTDITHINVR